jgi:hypothetical protein
MPRRRRCGRGAKVDSASASSATKFRSQSVIDNKIWRREERLLKSLASLLFPAAPPEHRNQQNKPGSPRQVHLKALWVHDRAVDHKKDKSPFCVLNFSNFAVLSTVQLASVAELRRATLRRHPGTAALNISKSRLDHLRRGLALGTERPVVLPSAPAKEPV